MSHKTSSEGVGAIEAREGVKLAMYRDSAGLPTIGCGHLLTKDELSSGKITDFGWLWHQGLTQPQVDELLGRDLSLAELTVNSAVRVELAQCQFDCLVSFVFNVGQGAFLGSTLLKVLNQALFDQVPDQLRRWTHSAGVVDPILVKRRESEVNQWLGRLG